MIRTDFRNLFVQALREAQTDAGNKVFPTRPEVLQQEDLPAIVVSTPSDDLERSTDDPRSYRHRVTVQIDLFVDDTKIPKMGEPWGVPDVLVLAEDLEEQVHIVMSDPSKFLKHPGVPWCDMEELEWEGTLTGTDAHGRRPIGSAQIRYGLVYITDAPELPDGPLKDLLTLGTKWDPGTPDQSSILETETTLNP